MGHNLPRVGKGMCFLIIEWAPKNNIKATVKQVNTTGVVEYKVWSLTKAWKRGPAERAYHHAVTTWSRWRQRDWKRRFTKLEGAVSNKQRQLGEEDPRSKRKNITLSISLVVLRIQGKGSGNFIASKKGNKKMAGNNCPKQEGKSTCQLMT